MPSTAHSGRGGRGGSARGRSGQSGRKGCRGRKRKNRKLESSDDKDGDDSEDGESSDDDTGAGCIDSGVDMNQDSDGDEGAEEAEMEEREGKDTQSCGDGPAAGDKVMIEPGSVWYDPAEMELFRVVKVLKKHVDYRQLEESGLCSGVEWRSWKYEVLRWVRVYQKNKSSYPDSPVQHA